MLVKEENGRWKIIRLELDHNHPLYPGNREQLFSGHKYMTEMEKAIIRTLNANNIATRQMISILSYLRGGVTALPYKKKDVANFRTKLNRVISGSDMKQALNYFIEKKNKDPSFFYKFDVDEHLRVKNIFWRDAESLKYYAVSFDTTYMTNKYNLPFAPFVGVTGHGHTCLFGCAFICDETIDTFKWVFESFSEAMGGKHPTTIITDQDAAMKAAIEQTFSNTKHRNCLFHIKTKCYNKNLKCFASNEGLPEEFEDVVGNSLTIEEFETLWTQMIADYKLENNKYFNKINILSKFMKELRATTRLSYKELEQQGQYEVWEKHNQIHKRHRFRKYIVITDLTNGREDYSCICGKFNKDGILCSHILKILVEIEASKIPDKYIIERWRKKERKIQLKKVASNTGTDDILRFNILSRKAAELTSKGATKEEAMEYLLEEFSRIGKNLDIMLATRNKEIPQETSTADALGPTRESTIEAQINIREQSEDTSTVQDPVSIKKKGRPEKPKRWKARVEQEREKAKKQQQKKTKKAETSSKEVLENFEIDVTKK
ncbi:hypothetical protein SORBI_3009G147450 [Sorghum bicolor]|uniref:SWIM-type domain-containing protein n=1 Tax=Sorghum bicolor TaxID=4558 RepID=A0A1Z5R3P5_SORBI|nr:hypothetical protein SORBI_3009G147450 [Sorghum bicolor]